MTPSEEGAADVGRHVAVIGAGPSGVYAAEDMATRLGWSVDVIDRLPTPYGLLRYGVAPDHMKMKSLARALERVFAHSNVRFFGNVEVGRDIRVEELRARYDAVIYAVGAPGHRRLGVPGEDLIGVQPATDLVAWYSGHPDAAAPPDLSAARSAVVIGAGNVALDVARLLAKSAHELLPTDVPGDVIEALERSALTDIHIVCRRGPADVKFTYKELAEMGELENADVVVHAGEYSLDSEGVMGAQATIIDLFRQWAERESGRRKSRTVHFHFGLRPERVNGTRGVEAITFGSAGGDQVIPVDLVVTAIGSFGRAMVDVDFDAGRGVIPHLDGRVQPPSPGLSGEYVVGWIKRGPSGVIGTNKADAINTVATVVADLEAAVDTVPHAVTRPFGEDEFGSAVLWDGWLGIDRAEIAGGAARGAARVKMATWDQLLASAGATRGDARS
ncbi:FAD-dependent oxidoreductase [Nocardia sp. NPDC004278]